MHAHSRIEMYIDMHTHIFFEAHCVGEPSDCVGGMSDCVGGGQKKYSSSRLSQNILL